MSGGERKKRTSRGQGWEEAGAEFYQESYPADVDLEVLQRDPSHIATLLPSKQSRAGMHAPTILRCNISTILECWRDDYFMSLDLQQERLLFKLNKVMIFRNILIALCVCIP
jgi:hypothetical protein